MAAALGALLATTGTPDVARAEPRWQRVETTLLREGSELPGGARRYAFPRTDLKITLDGVELRPALALGSWLAFSPVGDGGEAMVMGDLVLTQEEVAPVMRAFFFGPGLEVTALHNHLLRSEPQVMSLHVSGRGDAVALAQRLRLAIEQSATPVAPVPQAEQQPEPDLDMAAIDRILGHRGRATGGAYAVSVPRAEAIREHGVTVPGALGLATAIAIQPLRRGQAAVTGDFVLLGSEVGPVTRTLAQHRIEVTAIHNHMLGEEPRLFFVHFWGVGDAEELTGGLRAALDQTNTGLK
jgi:hypothetical protein